MVSIIIPIYNQEKYLKKCLNSVQNQTFSNFEVILINDGSTDSSLAICNEFVSIDKRFKVFSTENRGQSKARNLGLSYATRPYITFIDSDDWLDDDMLATLIYKLKEYDADISCCGYVVEDELNRRSIKIWEGKEDSLWCRKEALSKLFINKEMKDFLWAKLYKAELWEGVKLPEGVLYEDVRVQYKIFNKSEKIVKVNKAKYHYVQHDSNTTSYFTKNVKKEIDHYYAYYELYNFVNKNPKEVIDVDLIKSELIRKIYRAQKQIIRRFPVFSDEFKYIRKETIIHYRQVFSQVNIFKFGFLRYLGFIITLHVPIFFSFFLWLRRKKRKI